MANYKYELTVNGQDVPGCQTKRISVNIIADGKTQIKCDGIVIISFWPNGDIKLYENDIRRAGLTTSER